MPTKLGNSILYSVEEVAQKLNVTPASVRNYLRQGNLKGQKILRMWLIEEKDLKVFMKKWE
jgi:excisionase family DNA binding protein